MSPHFYNPPSSRCAHYLTSLFWKGRFWTSIQMTTAMRNCILTDYFNTLGWQESRNCIKELILVLYSFTKLALKDCVTNFFNV